MRTPLSLRGGKATAFSVGINRAWMCSLEGPQMWTIPFLRVMEIEIGKEEADHTRDLCDGVQTVSLPRPPCSGLKPQGDKDTKFKRGLIAHCEILFSKVDRTYII